MGACASKPKVKSEDAPSRAPPHTSSARRVARSLINPLAGSPARKQAAAEANSAAATPEKEVLEGDGAISRADEQGSKRRSLKILFRENEDDMDTSENINKISESAKQEPTPSERAQQRSDLELESLKPEPVKTHEKSPKEPETRMELGTPSYTKKPEPVEPIAPAKVTEMKLLESEIKLLESKAKALSETAKREMIPLPPNIPPTPPEDTDTKLLEFVEPPDTERSTIEPEIKFPELGVKAVPVPTRQIDNSELEPKPEPEPKQDSESKNKPEAPEVVQELEKSEKPSQPEIKKPSKKHSLPMIDKVSPMKHSKSETQIQSFSGSSPEFQAKRLIFETSTPPIRSKPSSPLSKPPDQMKKSESESNFAPYNNPNPPPKTENIDQSSRQQSLDFVDAYDKMVVDKAVVEAGPASAQVFVEASQKSPTKNNPEKENSVLLPDFIQMQVDKAMKEPVMDAKIESNEKVEMETESSFPEAMKIENHGKAKVETKSSVPDATMPKTESNKTFEKTENDR